MVKKGKSFIIFLALITIGLTMEVLHQVDDIRGFSLSEREAALAVAGGNNSFLFEVTEGDFEFKLYRIQNGELVDEQVFAGGGAVIDERAPEGLQVAQKRNLVTINAAESEPGTWVWSIGTEPFFLGRDIKVSEVENNSRMWGSIQNGFQLDGAEIPILYIAFTSGAFPTALESIVSGRFDVREQVGQFSEVDDLFIVTISRLN